MEKFYFGISERPANINFYNRCRGLSRDLHFSLAAFEELAKYLIFTAVAQLEELVRFFFVDYVDSIKIQIRLNLQWKFNRVVVEISGEARGQSMP